MNSSKLPTPARLLGATVASLGTITAADPHGVYVLITDACGLEPHRFVSQLEHVRLSAPQPYKTVTRRIGYGLWGEAVNLIPCTPASRPDLKRAA